MEGQPLPKLVEGVTLALTETELHQVCFFFDFAMSTPVSRLLLLPYCCHLLPCWALVVVL